MAHTRTPAPAPGRRRITAHRYRTVRAWTAAQCFDGWAMADRVMAVVAALIEDDAGVVHGDELAVAIRETATVDCALDLLGLSGATCA